MRVVRRADGYYCQFLIDHDRVETRKPTGKAIGLDVGLNHFYTDKYLDKNKPHCINLCKVAKSLFAPCSLLPAPYFKS